MRKNQTPSRYSIYNNALPYYVDRVDITTLTEQGPDFSNQFLKSVFDFNLNLQIECSNLVADRVKHLFFESKNIAKVTGIKSFGFGYPLIVDTYEGELIAAPLFIWQINLEPAQTKSNSWILKFEKNGHVRPNSHLISFLKEKYDFDFTEKLEQLAFSKMLNAKSLNDISDELSKRFQYIVAENQEIVPSPGIDEIGAIADNGSIQMSGVLGIYPPQHNSWESGKIKPEDVFVPFNEGVVKDDLIIPYLSVDPEQNSVLEEVLSNKITVVEGSTFKSKSEVLVNLLVTLLIQGKKCLVVSEYAPVLKQTIAKLSQIGLNHLHYLLTDIMNEKDQFLEMLRIAAKSLGRQIDFDENDFNFKKNKYLRDKAKFDLAYSAVRTKVFGELKWPDVVGLYLSNHFIEKKELLATHLNKDDFEFTIAERSALIKGVQNSFPLFQNVKTLNHPLSELNDLVFQQVSLEDGRLFVDQQLNEFHGKATALHHQYISGIDKYKSKLDEFYSDHIDKIENFLSQLKEKLLSYSDQYGSDFAQVGTGIFSFPIFYSKKKRQIVSSQKDVASKYDRLIAYFDGNRLFDHEFSAPKSNMSVSDIKENISEFEISFQIWKNGIGTLIQEEAIRLNSKTAHPKLGLKEEISTLEFALETFLEELNEASLYKKVYENKTLTIVQRQKYLESIIEKLENTQLSLRDFSIFYKWQSNWINIGAKGQKVIKALVKVKPNDWSAAFGSWYFYHLLLAKQPKGLPTDDSIIDELYSSWHALKPLVLNYISKTWQDRQSKSLKSLRRTNKTNYKAIFEHNPKKEATKNPLERIVEGGFEAITDFFPILFVSPHTALNLIPQDFKFDFIIFDEANRFSIEQGSNIVPLGNQSALFGKDLTYGNETSLLQYALENDIQEIKLNEDIVLPEKEANQLSSIQYNVDFVDGRYHEIDNSNDVEAQHIIRYLNQIKQTPQRVYPSVGIVTFTKEQRDLISSYFLKLKQQNDVSSEKIRQLERNGLGVYYAEEVFGQHFDILILSCTFGSVDIKGKITKRVALLNTPEGISFLKMIVRKQVGKICIFHSFPKKRLNDMRGKQWEEGAWYLAILIELAEAYSGNNSAEIITLSENLGLHNVNKNVPSILAKEISTALHSYIEKECVLLEKDITGQRIPILIDRGESKELSSLAIIPDAFLSENPYSSFQWEHSQRQNLKKNEIEVKVTFSSDWLKNPDKELRRLASAIIKFNRKQEVDEERNALKSRIPDKNSKNDD